MDTLDRTRKLHGNKNNASGTASERIANQIPMEPGKYSNPSMMAMVPKYTYILYYILLYTTTIIYYIIYYYKLYITEVDILKAGVTTQFGFYELCRIPMASMKTCSQTFERFTQETLQDLH